MNEKTKYRLIDGVTPEALAQLGSRSCSMVVTDPPYCSGASNTAKRRPMGTRYASNVGIDYAGDNMSERVFMKFTEDWMRECLRIVGVGKMFCFIDWRMWATLEEAAQRAGWQVVNQLVWNKGSGRGMPDGFAFSHELILMARVGHMTQAATPFYSSTSVLTYNRVPHGKKQHVMQKPVDLIAEFLQVQAYDDRPVLDPFAGSGATLMAAAKCGRPSVMIEHDPDHCETIQAAAVNLEPDNELAAESVDFANLYSYMKNAASAEQRETAENDRGQLFKLGAPFSV